MMKVEVTNMKEKLLQIQKALKAPKSQFNNFGKYHYRNCEDILEALKPLLVDCCLTISDEVVEISGRFYIKATAMIKDEKDIIFTTAYAREEESKKGMDGAQVSGAASSYARKYALNGLFLIDDTKDADTLNQGEKAEPKTAMKDFREKINKEDDISEAVETKDSALVDFLNTTPEEQMTTLRIIQAAVGYTPKKEPADQTERTKYFKFLIAKQKGE